MKARLLGAVALTAMTAFAGLPAAAQQIIDTGLRTGDFSFTAAVDTSVSSSILGLPLFNDLLGSISNVDFNVGGTFFWADPVYSIDHQSSVGFLGTETGTLTYHVGDYLVGGRSSLPTPPSILNSAFCNGSPGQTCLSGSFPFPSVTQTIPTQTATGTDLVIHATNLDPTSTTEMSIDFSSSFSGEEGSFAESGDYLIHGQADVDIKYIALSKAEYLQEAVNYSRNGAFAVSFVTDLREQDAGTSGQNLTLRDAEYTLMGYNSGSKFALALQAGNLAAAKSALWFNDNSADRYASPFAAEGYLALKALAAVGCIPCGDLVASLGTPGLPGTPPDVSSQIANEIGFFYGVNNPSEISGLPSAKLVGLLAGGADPLSPTAPLETVAAGPDGSPAIAIYAFSVTAGTDTYVDPSRADLIAIGVTGAGISAFEIPFIAGQQDITGATLEVNGITVAIIGGEWYDLNSLFGFDPQTILLSDIEGALVPDELVFGFRFDQTGDIAMINIGAAVSGVPESSTWAMMLLGFAGLGYAGFKRRPTARLAEAIARRSQATL